VVLLAVCAAVAALSIAFASRVTLPNAAQGLGAIAFAAIAVWMFVSERLEWPCIVLGLYLGCLDGYLKLATGSSSVTLGRNVLLYAIVLGFLARAALRGRRLSLPPLTGWVIAYAAVVFLQLLNPGDTGVHHTIAALRPHLEFVPLFFLGYALVQTTDRIRAFFVVLLICALANGVVAFVQLNLSTEQLSSWGPGYSAKVNGTGDVSGRVFTDDEGKARVRPFGLGGDASAGGLVGVVSLGAALAMIALAFRRRANRWALVLCVGPPLAIITGQGRSAVVAGVIVLLVFVMLATSVRRLVPTLAGVLLAVGVTVAIFSFVQQSSGTGIFDRYKTITPARLSSETESSRGNSIDRIPELIRTQPFGAGLGYVGPAAQFASASVVARNVDGETEVTFLLSELGVAGLVVLLGFNLRLLIGSVRTVRRMRGDERILLAGVVAGLAGALTMWASSAPLAQSPVSPFFWFTAGVLAYWITAGPSRAPAPTTAKAAAEQPVERVLSPA
jgi:hypothetical protein